MRINPVNYNSTPKKQNFKGINEFTPGATEKLLGFSKQQAFSALSNIKKMDVWVFDIMKGKTEGSVMDGYHIIVSDGSKIIKELVGAPEKQGKIAEKLEELVLWFNPEANKEAASVISKINTMNNAKLAEIQKEYTDPIAKQEAIDAVLFEEKNGKKFISDFCNRLYQTAKSAETTPWEEKVKGIQLDTVS